MKMISILSCFFCVSSVVAQTGREDGIGMQLIKLPITKISILSSGLAYYEHSGTVNGPAVIELPFKASAINDALKSLIVNDSATANPSVLYQSEQTLIQTLRSLKIDLSGNPDMAAVLRGLRGAEIELTVQSQKESGRIVGVEFRAVSDDVQEAWLSLNTGQGIKMFNFKDINSIVFKDPQLASDLNRALDLIASSRNTDLRNLSVRLPGNGSRNVTISYVIPAPVWKVSYRLDFGSDANAKPLLQGWAIVDNDSDFDWSSVRLSLIAGRPASFIQNLYPPYYLSRPVLPLAIAGAASAVTHDAGYAIEAPSLRFNDRLQSARAMADSDMMYAEDEEVAMEMMSVPSGTINTFGTTETAAGAAAGDQFEFTVKNPVSLDRRMSSMLPLAESAIEARKVLIFSGSNAAGRNINPRLGAELTNTSKMKLPAGPITVYDGGAYAGDALIEFWNEGEKRFISFGEDLSVTGAVMDSSSRTMASVNIASGIMTLNRRQENKKSYTFKNNSAAQKTLIVEHPKTSGSELSSPKADEQTPALYRFFISLPAEKETKMDVIETRIIAERVTLSQLRPENLLTYAANDEIPANVKQALQKAIELRTQATAAQTAVSEAERQNASYVSEQDRIRKNLEAVGNQSEQGKGYLNRLTAIDENIDRLAEELAKLRENARASLKAYEDYLATLSL